MLCTADLWFVLRPDVEFETFARGCGGDGSARRSAAPGVEAAYGCLSPARSSQRKNGSTAAVGTAQGPTPLPDTAPGPTPLPASNASASTDSKAKQSKNAGLDPLLNAKPQPYIKAATSRLAVRTIMIHGVSLVVAARHQGHTRLIREHVSREINGYALLKDAIAHARKHRPSERPLVMDIGSNHGAYSLFAARLGADVITLEPQSHLCRVINRAAALNNVTQRITLYNAAALDKRRRHASFYGSSAAACCCMSRAPSAR
jgi:hypothetical protein